jgi:hypothetical protein
VKETTPEKLIVCICKVKPAYSGTVDKFFAEGGVVPTDITAVRHARVLNEQDLIKNGLIWLGGPLSGADYQMSMNVFAVDSIEKARELQRRDPAYVQGLFYDDQYFEWTIHLPFKKVSPSHRAKVEHGFRDAGVSTKSMMG